MASKTFLSQNCGESWAEHAESCRVRPIFWKQINGIAETGHNAATNAELVTEIRQKHDVGPRISPQSRGRAMPSTQVISSRAPS